MAKRKQKISRAPAKSFTPPQHICPAVSVIIPLYNAEKYIGECLDSILAQTFQNFEVIVVDDCSTDNGAAIVESYAEKFGGRLTISRTEKNSGNAGYTARNRGLLFSRGEYIYFVDADDFITKTALEEMYAAAKNNDADVVYMGARYLYTDKSGAELKLDGLGLELKANGQEDKLSLTVDDPHKNLQFLLFGGFFWTSWTKFVKRNFLAEHDITFYEVPSCGDHLWTIELVARSERFLRIPNAVYFWRDDSLDSMTRVKLSTEAQIVKWIKIFILWEKSCYALANKIEILRENPGYFYAAMVNQFNFCMKRTFEECLQVQPEQIFEILRRDFESKGDSDLTVPFLFSLLDSQQKYLLQAQQQFEQFNQFAAQAQARIAQLEAELKRKS